MFPYRNMLKILYRYNSTMSSNNTLQCSEIEQKYLVEFFKTLRKEQVIENIRFLRNSIAQKSLRIFAYENDIPCATLSRIENGIRIPNLLILRKIAAGLNFDLSTLISKVEENIPEDLKGFDI